MNVHALLLLWIMAAALANSAWARGPAANCNSGQSIARAIERARPGQTIFIQGMCKETLVITKDDVIIDGRGRDGTGTTVWEPEEAEQTVVTLNGARRVTLMHITFQNGANGAVATGGASVTLDHIQSMGHTVDGVRIERNSSARIVQGQFMNNGDDGVEIDQNAAATLVDCTSQNNGDDGFLIRRGGTATFNGVTTGTDNGDDGIKCTGSSDFNLFGGTVNLDRNGDDGIALSQTSNAITSAALTTSNNGDNGIQIIITASMIPAGNATIISSNNGDDGIAIGTSSSFFPIGNTEMTLENNADNGLSVAQASAVRTTSQTQLTSRNNAGVGILTGLTASSTFLGTVLAEGNGEGDIIDENVMP